MIYRGLNWTKWIHKVTYIPKEKLVDRPNVPYEGDDDDECGVYGCDYGEVHLHHAHHGYVHGCCDCGEMYDAYLCGAL